MVSGVSGVEGSGLCDLSSRGSFLQLNLPKVSICGSSLGLPYRILHKTWLNPKRDYNGDPRKFPCLGSRVGRLKRHRLGLGHT